MYNMNKYPALQERRSIGQVQPGTMIDLTPIALEKRMKRELRDQRVQSIGKAFRGIIDGFKVNPIGDTSDPYINRITGRRVIVAGLSALAIVGALSIAELATPDDKVCVTKSSESTEKWTNISNTAHALHEQGAYVAENSQLYDAWDNGDQICMIDRQGPLSGVIERFQSGPMATNS